MMDLLTTIITGIGIAGAGAIGKLWLTCVKLGSALDRTNRLLGRLEGFVQAVDHCPARGCPHAGKAPSLEEISTH
jgi:hypothetical protein